MLCHYINQYTPGKLPHMQSHTQHMHTHLLDSSYVSKVIKEDYK